MFRLASAAFAAFFILFASSAMEAQTKTSPNIVTMLEAHVDEANWSKLRTAYQGLLGKLGPEIVRTVLVQGANDPTLWRIMTVWRSREDLEKYRASVETPGGVLAFRSAGAEPTLGIFTVVEAAP